MDHSLPDEIISEILSPALKISDETFSATVSISPFASYSQSTSAYLLVCKAWLRVSTPLLYNVVVIRSKAQAQALEAALKANKDLGTFIKKLRVEGGYGMTMALILKRSPKITDLVLSLAIWSADGVSGLCQGLHLIDPIRLIVHDVEEPRSNKQNIRLVEKLVECIALWKNLRVVDLPYRYDWELGETSRCSQVCGALKKAPFLETVLIPIPICVGLPAFLTDIRQNPSLKTLRIKEPIAAWWHIVQDINDDLILKELIQYTIADEPDDVQQQPEISPSLDPSFVPMQHSPQEVQESIWKRILYFALRVDELDAHLASDDHVPNSCGSEPNPFSDINLMLVSKMFKKLSGLYFYRYICLEVPGDLEHFSTMLLKDLSLAKHVRSISVDKYAAAKQQPEFYSYHAHADEEEQWAANAAEFMTNHLPLLIGLVSFTGAFHNSSSFPPRPQITSETLAITWDAFQTLGSTAGSSLRRFYLEVTPPEVTQSPLIFNHFTALRSMEWKCKVEFDSNLELLLTTAALARLECISVHECHSTFWTLLTQLQLPSLCRVYVYEHLPVTSGAFLKRHGSKLTELGVAVDDPGEIHVLNTCPNLPLLICYTPDTDTQNTTPQIAMFSPTEPHLSLTKVILEACYSYNRKEEKIMETFMKSLDPEMFPALREIQVYNFYWPATERDIAKSFWVRWAEMLLGQRY
ncbi:hypothetical protein B0H10DRAFT_116655 [Mycena sp. CBHHK59/15]|nr:hypothetical protein B0H10DRAFT_116655 [Mycena sp. CBHHK59/15]